MVQSRMELSFRLVLPITTGTEVGILRIGTVPIGITHTGIIHIGTEDTGAEDIAPTNRNAPTLLSDQGLATTFQEHVPVLLSVRE